MNRVDNIRRESGFTLIELMLAMTFISLLLVAIAMTTIQISNIYNKGLTLTAVNQAGRDVSATMRRDIGAAMPLDTTADGELVNYTVTSNGGRLCLGSYSYLWNYGSTLTDGVTGEMITYQGTDEPVVLARVQDKDAQLCADLESQPDKALATELTANDSLDLALHSLDFKEIAVDALTGQALYAVSFQVGTNEEGTLDSSTCRPPDDAGANPEFCAVNEFNIVVRAGGSQS